MAVANYHERYGHYPPAFVRGPGGRPWHSWRVLILPFIEESKLHAEYDFDEPWDGPSNRKLAERMPRIFAFHSERREGNTTTNYATVVGAGTAWPGAETISHSDVTDGLSQTIMIVENRGAIIHWMEPRDLEFETMDFRLNQANGIGSPYDDPAVVLLDGSVQRLLTTLEPRTLRALLTIKGGEPIENDENKGWRFLPDGRRRPIRDD